MANKVGRPTEYNEDTISKAREYLESTGDSYVNIGSKLSPKLKIKVNIPTLEGLAVYLGVHKDTIQEWCKVHPEFSVFIGELKAKQANELINKGLSNDYNPTIAKVLLTKHGYREGIDTTTNDQPVVDMELKEKIDLAISKFLNAQATE